MPLKDYEDEKDRMIRIKSQDDEIFKKAYLELKASAEYAKLNFNGFPMHRQLQEALKKYSPRFNQLSNQPSKSNTCKQG